MTFFSYLFSRFGRLARSVPPANLAIAAILKDEAPYLLEWIAFHRVVGVERFFIADHESSDGTTDLLIALAAAGIIDRIPFRSIPGKPAQLPAYNALMRHFRTRARWFAFIDADEFLMPLDGMHTIGSLFESMAPDVGAVCVNWATYGSSGAARPTNALVIERFPRRADRTFSVNHHYKSIVRSEAFVRSSNPHCSVIGRWFRSAHPDGRTIVDHKLGTGISAEVVWHGVRLNHYVVKSKAEYDLIKTRRGRADVVVDVPRNRKFFAGHDRNDILDEMPDWLIAATKDEIEHLRSLLAKNDCPEALLTADQNIVARIDALVAASQ